MQHLFGKSVHTAFVVPNLEQAMQRMFESGFGPAFLLRQLAISGRFRRHRHDMVMDVAFFAVGGTHYEFIQQIDESASAYQEFLTLNPHGGMHHIAYYSEDFASDIARAKQAGARKRPFNFRPNPSRSMYRCQRQLPTQTLSFRLDRSRSATKEARLTREGMGPWWHQTAKTVPIARSRAKWASICS